MKAYYNEFDKKAAAWLRELIKQGLITDGEVDDRSITDVQASDIRRFHRLHFFAGIAGWERALQIAGWPDDRPIVTASLPCTPFSVAGKGLGKSDERHLLPNFIELVKQSNWGTIIGEQVPSAIKHGWLDDLQTEMGREGYAVGSVVLTAAGSGAPHIRQRLYWVANSNKIRRNSGGEDAGQETRGSSRIDSRCACDERLADSSSQGLERWTGTECADKFTIGKDCLVNGVENSESERKRGASRKCHSETRTFEDKRGYEDREFIQSITGSSISRMGNTEHNGSFTGEKSGSYDSPIFISEARADSSSEFERAGLPRVISSIDYEWSDVDWIYCRDNKYRPIKRGLKPLVNGISRGMGCSSNNGLQINQSESEQESLPIRPNETSEARVMRLKGYGNAIVPQTAAEFIQAFMSVTND